MSGSVAPPSKIERRVRRACWLSLLALGLIMWSQVHPRPMPVIVAMSVGQVIGTLSLLMFVHAIVADLRGFVARLRARRGAGTTPPPPGDDPPPPA